MKRIFVSLSMVFFLMIPSLSMASHAGPIEFYYRWISDSTYEVTGTFYRYCVGTTASPPTMLNITAASKSTGMQVVGNLLPLPQIPSVPLQPANLFDCIPSAGMCYEEYVYRGNVTLRGKARDWIFQYEVCCLPNSGAVNVPVATPYSFATLNNLDFPDMANKNTSPIFHTRRPNHPSAPNQVIYNPPILTMCAGRLQILDEHAVEYDGDALSYEFTEPLTTGGTLMGYLVPYSFSYPMDMLSPPGLTLDSLTGELKFTPINRPGGGNFSQYYLTMVVHEYRNDTISVSPLIVQSKEIGSVQRNLFFMVQIDSLCPVQKMTFGNGSNPPASLSNLEVQCSITQLDLNLTSKFLCSSLDADGSCFLLIDSATSSSVSITSAVLQATCNFKDQLNSLTIILGTTLTKGGTYYLMFKNGTDSNTLINECAGPIIPYLDTLTLHVTDPGVGEIKGKLLSPGIFSDLLDAECNQEFFDIILTNKVDCRTVDPAGSDFFLYSNTPPISSTAIVSAAALNCVKNETDRIRIQTIIPLKPGSYTLQTQHGNDGNIFLNFCGDPWSSNSISVEIPDLNINLGKDTTICEEDNFTTFLNAGSGFASYKWNSDPNATNQTLYISGPGTFYVEAILGFGCVRTDSITISEISCYEGIASSLGSKVEVYPNPASDLLYFSFKELKSEVQIKIYNTLGEEQITVVRNEKSNQPLDISFLSPGIYLIKIQAQNAPAWIQRFVVQ